ncbi:scabin-related ADP-ribosyltransferase [Saccharopolyspora shandongensis]|uniref:WXG100-like domain-containing protein n=1 Tax=Saccharopolyspora shandongensis TaxID=418495 RepID=UPI0034013CB8
MPTELPAGLQEALRVVGGQAWPEGDEDGLNRIADAWEKVVSDIIVLRDAMQASAADVSRDMRGDFANAYRNYAETKVEDSLFKLKQSAQELSDLARNTAADIQAAKISICVQLGFVALAIVTAFAPIIGGLISGGIVATARFAIAQIIKGVVLNIAQNGVKTVATNVAKNIAASAVKNVTVSSAKAAAKNVAKNVAVNAAIGEGLAMGIEGGTQLGQIASGQRTELNHDRLKGAAISGAFGGVGGGVAQSAADGLGKAIAQGAFGEAVKEGMKSATGQVTGATINAGMQGVGGYAGEKAADAVQGHDAANSYSFTSAMAGGFGKLGGGAHISEQKAGDLAKAGEAAGKAADATAVGSVKTESLGPTSNAETNSLKTESSGLANTSSPTTGKGEELPAYTGPTLPGYGEQGSGNDTGNTANDTGTVAQQQASQTTGQQSGNESGNAGQTATKQDQGTADQQQSATESGTTTDKSSMSTGNDGTSHLGADEATKTDGLQAVASDLDQHAASEITNAAHGLSDVQHQDVDAHQDADLGQGTGSEHAGQVQTGSQHVGAAQEHGEAGSQSVGSEGAGQQTGSQNQETATQHGDSQHNASNGLHQEISGEQGATTQQVQSHQEAGSQHGSSQQQTTTTGEEHLSKQDTSHTTEHEAKTPATHTESAADQHEKPVHSTETTTAKQEAVGDTAPKSTTQTMSDPSAASTRPDSQAETASPQHVTQPLGATSESTQNLGTNQTAAKHETVTPNPDSTPKQETGSTPSEHSSEQATATQQTTPPMMLPPQTQPTVHHTTVDQTQSTAQRGPTPTTSPTPATQHPATTSSGAPHAPSQSNSQTPATESRPTESTTQGKKAAATTAATTGDVRPPQRPENTLSEKAKGKQPMRTTKSSSDDVAAGKPKSGSAGTDATSHSGVSDQAKQKAHELARKKNLYYGGLDRQKIAEHQLNLDKLAALYEHGDAKAAEKLVHELRGPKDNPKPLYADWATKPHGVGGAPEGRQPEGGGRKDPRNWRIPNEDTARRIALEQAVATARELGMSLRKIGKTYGFSYQTTSNLSIAGGYRQHAAGLGEGFQFADKAAGFDGRSRVLLAEHLGRSPEEVIPAELEAWREYVSARVDHDVRQIISDQASDFGARAEGSGARRSGEAQAWLEDGKEGLEKAETRLAAAVNGLDGLVSDPAGLYQLYRLHLDEHMEAAGGQDSSALDVEMAESGQDVSLVGSQGLGAGQLTETPVPGSEAGPSNPLDDFLQQDVDELLGPNPLDDFLQHDMDELLALDQGAVSSLKESHRSASVDLRTEGHGGDETSGGVKRPASPEGPDESAKRAREANETGDAVFSTFEEDVNDPGADDFAVSPDANVEHAEPSGDPQSPTVRPPEQTGQFMAPLVAAASAGGWEVFKDLYEGLPKTYQGVVLADPVVVEGLRALGVSRAELVELTGISMSAIWKLFPDIAASADIAGSADSAGGAVAADVVAAASAGDWAEFKDLYEGLPKIYQGVVLADPVVVEGIRALGMSPAELVELTGISAPTVRKLFPDIAAGAVAPDVVAAASAGDWAEFKDLYGELSRPQRSMVLADPVVVEGLRTLGMSPAELVEATGISEPTVRKLLLDAAGSADSAGGAVAADVIAAASAGDWAEFKDLYEGLPKTYQGVVLADPVVVEGIRALGMSRAELVELTGISAPTVRKLFPDIAGNAGSAVVPDVVAAASSGDWAEFKDLYGELSRPQRSMVLADPVVVEGLRALGMSPVELVELTGISAPTVRKLLGGATQHVPDEAEVIVRGMRDRFEAVRGDADEENRVIQELSRHYLVHEGTVQRIVDWRGHDDSVTSHSGVSEQANEKALQLSSQEVDSGSGGGGSSFGPGRPVEIGDFGGHWRKALSESGFDLTDEQFAAVRNYVRAQEVRDVLAANPDLSAVGGSQDSAGVLQRAEEAEAQLGHAQQQVDAAAGGLSELLPDLKQDALYAHYQHERAKYYAIRGHAPGGSPWSAGSQGAGAGNLTETPVPGGEAGPSNLATQSTSDIGHQSDHVSIDMGTDAIELQEIHHDTPPPASPATQHKQDLVATNLVKATDVDGTELRADLAGAMTELDIDESVQNAFQAAFSDVQLKDDFTTLSEEGVTKSIGHGPGAVEVTVRTRLVGVESPVEGPPAGEPKHEVDNASGDYGKTSDENASTVRREKGADLTGMFGLGTTIPMGAVEANASVKASAVPGWKFGTDSTLQHSSKVELSGGVRSARHDLWHEITVTRHDGASTTRHGTRESGIEVTIPESLRQVSDTTPVVDTQVPHPQHVQSAHLRGDNGLFDKITKTLPADHPLRRELDAVGSTARGQLREMASGSGLSLRAGDLLGGREITKTLEYQHHGRTRTATVHIGASVHSPTLIHEQDATVTGTGGAKTEHAASELTKQSTDVRFGGGGLVAIPRTEDASFAAGARGDVNVQAKLGGAGSDEHTMKNTTGTTLESEHTSTGQLRTYRTGLGYNARIVFDDGSAIEFGEHHVEAGATVWMSPEAAVSNGWDSASQQLESSDSTPGHSDTATPLSHISPLSVLGGKVEFGGVDRVATELHQILDGDALPPHHGAGHQSPHVSENVDRINALITPDAFAAHAAELVGDGWSFLLPRDTHVGTSTGTEHVWVKIRATPGRYEATPVAAPGDGELKGTLTASSHDEHTTKIKGNWIGTGGFGGVIPVDPNFPLRTAQVSGSYTRKIGDFERTVTATAGHESASSWKTGTHYRNTQRIHYTIEVFGPNGRIGERSFSADATTEVPVGSHPLGGQAGETPPASTAEFRDHRSATPTRPVGWKQAKLPDDYAVHSLNLPHGMGEKLMLEIKAHDGLGDDAAAGNPLGHLGKDGVIAANRVHNFAGPIEIGANLDRAATGTYHAQVERYRQGELFTGYSDSLGEAAMHLSLSNPKVIDHAESLGFELTTKSKGSTGRGEITKASSDTSIDGRTNARLNQQGTMVPQGTYTATDESGSGTTHTHEHENVQKRSYKGPGYLVAFDASIVLSGRNTEHLIGPVGDIYGKSHWTHSQVDAHDAVLLWVPADQIHQIAGLDDIDWHVDRPQDDATTHYDGGQFDEPKLGDGWVNVRPEVTRNLVSNLENALKTLTHDQLPESARVSFIGRLYHSVTHAASSAYSWLMDPSAGRLDAMVHSRLFPALSPSGLGSLYSDIVGGGIRTVYHYDGPLGRTDITITVKGTEKPGRFAGLSDEWTLSEESKTTSKLAEQQMTATTHTVQGQAVFSIFPEGQIQHNPGTAAAGEGSYKSQTTVEDMKSIETISKSEHAGRTLSFVHDLDLTITIEKTSGWGRLPQSLSFGVLDRFFPATTSEPINVHASVKDAVRHLVPETDRHLLEQLQNAANESEMDWSAPKHELPEGSRGTVRADRVRTEIDALLDGALPAGTEGRPAPPLPAGAAGTRHLISAMTTQSALSSQLESAMSEHGYRIGGLDEDRYFEAGALNHGPIKSLTLHAELRNPRVTAVSAEGSSFEGKKTGSESLKVTHQKTLAGGISARAGFGGLLWNSNPSGPGPGQIGRLAGEVSIKGPAAEKVVTDTSEVGGKTFEQEHASSGTTYLVRSDVTWQLTPEYRGTNVPAHWNEPRVVREPGGAVFRTDEAGLRALGLEPPEDHASAHEQTPAEEHVDAEQELVEQDDEHTVQHQQTVAESSGAAAKPKSLSDFLAPKQEDAGSTGEHGPHQELSEKQRGKLPWNQVHGTGGHGLGDDAASGSAGHGSELSQQSSHGASVQDQPGALDEAKPQNSHAQSAADTGSVVESSEVPGEESDPAGRLLAELNAATLSDSSPVGVLPEPDLFGLHKPAEPPEFLRGHDYSDITAGQGLDLLQRLDLKRPAPDWSELAPHNLRDLDDFVLTRELSEQERGAWSENQPPLPAKLELVRGRASIWLGGSLDDGSAGKREMRANIADSHEQLRGWAPMVVFTDVPRALFEQAAQFPVGDEPGVLSGVREMLGWAEDNNVTLVNVHEVFHSSWPMPHQEAFLAELAKQTKPGYTAASDLLRVAVGQRFGLLYSDGEYATSRGLLDEMQQVLDSREAYGVHKRGRSVNNDLLVLPKGHPFADKFFEQMRDNYGQSQDKLHNAPSFITPEAFVTNSMWRPHRYSVISRTGPINIEELGNELGHAGRDRGAVAGPPMDTGGQWVSRPRPTPSISLQDRAATFELTKKIVQTLVRELHNRDGDLHLTLVADAVHQHEAPDVIWTAALGYLAQRPELAGLVRTVTDRELVSITVDRHEDRRVELPEQARRYLRPQPGEEIHRLGEFSRPATMEQAPAELHGAANQESQFPAQAKLRGGPREASQLPGGSGHDMTGVPAESSGSRSPQHTDMDVDLVPAYAEVDGLSRYGLAGEDAGTFDSLFNSDDFASSAYTIGNWTIRGQSIDDIHFWGAVSGDGTRIGVVSEQPRGPVWQWYELGKGLVKTTLFMGRPTEAELPKPESSSAPPVSPTAVSSSDPTPDVVVDLGEQHDNPDLDPAVVVVIDEHGLQRPPFGGTENHLLHPDDVRGGFVQTEPGITAFRWLDEHPAGVLDYGLLPKDAVYLDSLKSHVTTTGRSQFVSTTIDPDYHHKNRRYRYEIRASKAGIDVRKTFDVRDIGWFAAEREKEVAFLGAIPKEDIVEVIEMVRDDSGRWTKNVIWTAKDEATSIGPANHKPAFGNLRVGSAEEAMTIAKQVAEMESRAYKAERRATQSLYMVDESLPSKYHESLADAILRGDGEKVDQLRKELHDALYGKRTIAAESAQGAGKRARLPGAGQEVPSWGYQPTANAPATPAAAWEAYYIALVQENIAAHDPALSGVGGSNTVPDAMQRAQDALRQARADLAAAERGLRAWGLDPTVQTEPVLGTDHMMATTSHDEVMVEPGGAVPSDARGLHSLLQDDLSELLDVAMDEAAALPVDAGGISPGSLFGQVSWQDPLPLPDGQMVVRFSADGSLTQLLHRDGTYEVVDSESGVALDRGVHDGALTGQLLGQVESSLPNAPDVVWQQDVVPLPDGRVARYSEDGLLAELVNRDGSFELVHPDTGFVLGTGRHDDALTGRLFTQTEAMLAEPDQVGAPPVHDVTAAAPGPVAGGLIGRVDTATWQEFKNATPQERKAVHGDPQSRAVLARRLKQAHDSDPRMTPYRLSKETGLTEPFVRKLIKEAGAGVEAPELAGRVGTASWGEFGDAGPEERQQVLDRPDDRAVLARRLKQAQDNDSAVKPYLLARLTRFDVETVEALTQEALDAAPAQSLAGRVGTASWDEFKAAFRAFPEERRRILASEDERAILARRLMDALDRDPSMTPLRLFKLSGIERTTVDRLVAEARYASTQSTSTVTSAPARVPHSQPPRRVVEASGEHGDSASVGSSDDHTDAMSDVVRHVSVEETGSVQHPQETGTDVVEVVDPDEIGTSRQDESVVGSDVADQADGGSAAVPGSLGDWVGRASWAELTDELMGSESKRRAVLRDRVARGVLAGRLKGAYESEHTMTALGLTRQTGIKDDTVLKLLHEAGTQMRPPARRPRFVPGGGAFRLDAAPSGQAVDSARNGGAGSSAGQSNSSTVAGGNDLPAQASRVEIGGFDAQWRETLHEVFGREVMAEEYRAWQEYAGTRAERDWYEANLDRSAEGGSRSASVVLQRAEETEDQLADVQARLDNAEARVREFGADPNALYDRYQQDRAEYYARQGRAPGGSSAWVSQGWTGSALISSGPAQHVDAPPSEDDPRVKAGSGAGAPFGGGVHAAALDSLVDLGLDAQRVDEVRAGFEELAAAGHLEDHSPAIAGNPGVREALQVIHANLDRIPEQSRGRLRAWVADAVLATALVSVRESASDSLAGLDHAAVQRRSAVRVLTPNRLESVLVEIAKSLKSWIDPFDAAWSALEHSGYRPDDGLPQRLVQLSLVNLTPQARLQLRGDALFQRLLSREGALVESMFASGGHDEQRFLATCLASVANTEVLGKVPTTAGLLLVGRNLVSQVRALIDNPPAKWAGVLDEHDQIFGRTIRELVSDRLDEAAEVFDDIELRASELIDSGGRNPDAWAELNQRWGRTMQKLSVVVDPSQGPDSVPVLTNKLIGGRWGWSAGISALLMVLDRPFRRFASVDNIGFSKALQTTLVDEGLQRRVVEFTRWSDEFGVAECWQRVHRNGGATLTTATHALWLEAVQRDGQQAFLVHDPKKSHPDHYSPAGMLEWAHRNKFTMDLVDPPDRPFQGEVPQKETPRSPESMVSTSDSLSTVAESVESATSSWESSQHETESSELSELPGDWPEPQVSVAEELAAFGLDEQRFAQARAELTEWAGNGRVEDYTAEILSRPELGRALREIRANLDSVPGLDVARLKSLVADAVLSAALVPVRDAVVSGSTHHNTNTRHERLAAQPLSPHGLQELLNNIADLTGRGKDPFQARESLLRHSGYEPEQGPSRRLTQLSLVNLNPHLRQQLVHDGLFQRLLENEEALGNALFGTDGHDWRDLLAAYGLQAGTMPTIGGLLQVGRAVVRHLDDQLTALTMEVSRTRAGQPRGGNAVDEFVRQHLTRTQEAFDEIEQMAQDSFDSIERTALAFIHSESDGTHIHHEQWAELTRAWSSTLRAMLMWDGPALDGLHAALSDATSTNGIREQVRITGETEPGQLWERVRHHGGTVRAAIGEHAQPVLVQAVRQDGTPLFAVADPEVDHVQMLDLNGFVRWADNAEAVLTLPVDHPQAANISESPAGEASLGGETSDDLGYWADESTSEPGSNGSLATADDSVPMHSSAGDGTEAPSAKTGDDDQHPRSMPDRSAAPASWRTTEYRTFGSASDSGGAAQKLARGPFAHRAGERIIDGGDQSFPRFLAERPVLVEEHPEVRISGDGTLAIAAHGHGAKEVFATLEVVRRAQADLNRVGGAVKLRVDESTGIEFEAGGKVQRLYRVVPDFGKGGASDISKEFTRDVLGASPTHAVLYDTRPPSAGGTGKLATAEINTTSDKEISGTHQLADALVSTTSEPVDAEWAAGQVRRGWDEQEHDSPTPGKGYGQAFSRTGAGGSAAAAKLGINEHARPRVGEGYLIQPISHGTNNDGSRRFSLDFSGSDEGRRVERMRFYRFAPVVLESADGQHHIVLENTRRREADNRFLRTVLEENITHYATRVHELEQILAEAKEDEGTGSRALFAESLLKVIEHQQKLAELGDQDSWQVKGELAAAKGNAVRALVALSGEEFGTSGDQWWFEMFGRAPGESLFESDSHLGDKPNALVLTVIPDHDDKRVQVEFGAGSTQLDELATAQMQRFISKLAGNAAWLAKQGAPLPQVHITVESLPDELGAREQRGAAVVQELRDHAAALGLDMGTLPVVIDHRVRDVAALRAQRSEFGFDEDEAIRTVVQVRAQLSGPGAEKPDPTPQELAELARTTGLHRAPTPLGKHLGKHTEVTTAEIDRMREIVRTARQLDPDRGGDPDWLTSVRRIADLQQRSGVADLDALVRQVFGRAADTEVRPWERRQLIDLVPHAKRSGRPVTLPDLIKAHEAHQWPMARESFDSIELRD